MDFRFRPGLLGDPTLAFGNSPYSQTNMGFCASGNPNFSSCGPGPFNGNFGCGTFRPSTPNNMMMRSRHPGPLNMAGGPIHQNVSIGQNQWTGRAQHNMGVARMMNASQCSTMNWSQGNFSCSPMNHMNNIPQFPMSQNALKPVMSRNPNLNPYSNQNSSHRMMMLQQQNFSGNYVQDISKMAMCRQQWFNGSNGMSSDNDVPDHKPLAVHNTRFNQWQAGHDNSNMVESTRSNTGCPAFPNRNIHQLTYGDKSGYQRQSRAVHCSREEVQVEKVVTRRTVTGTLRRSHMKKDNKACGEETVTVQTRKTIFRQTPLQEVFEYNHNSFVPSSGVRPVSLSRETQDSKSSGDRKSQVAQVLNGAHTENDQKDGSLDETGRIRNCISDAKTLVTEYHHKKCNSKNDSPTKTSDNPDLNVDRSPENDLRSEGNLSDSADDLIRGEYSVEKRKDKSFVRGLEDRHRRSRLDRWTEATVKDKPVEEVIQSRPDCLEKIPPHPVNKSLSLHHVHREKRSQAEDTSHERKTQLDLKRVKGKQTPDIIKEHEHIFSPSDKYSLLRSKRNSTSPSSLRSHLRPSNQQSKRRSSPDSAPENHPRHRKSEKGHHKDRTEKSHPSDVKSSKERRFKSSDAGPSVRHCEVISTLRQANPINASAARSYSLRGKSRGHSSHEEGKTGGHRAENKTEVDQLYAEKKFKGNIPPLRAQKEMRDSYRVTNKTRCSDPIVTEKSRPCCEEKEKRLHRDKTEKGLSGKVNRNKRRHSDPIVTSTKLPCQQKNEHVDFSPLHGTEIGHASHSKRTVLIKCPQSSVKNNQTHDMKTCRKQIKTSSSREVSVELKKNNMKMMKCQGFAPNKESNDDRPGFSFLKPNQNVKHTSKSPPRFWSSEYLNYVSSRNTQNSSDNDSETNLAKLKSSRCFLPRSVSLGRDAQKLPSSLQDAKRKVTKAANHGNSRQPVKQDPLFTPDPFTVVTRNKVSLNKITDESLKEVSSPGLCARPSLSKKSEHSSVESDSLLSTLTDKTCLDSQAEVPKLKESHKAVGSGLKITLIRGVKPGPKRPSENINGSEPKSIPVSRRTNPRTCVSARKHVVTTLLTGEKKRVRKSRSLECSPVDVKKEGQELVQDRRRMARRCLGDRFSLQLKSPLSHTESFVTPKSRDQAECNRKSLQRHFESLPGDTTTPLCYSKVLVNHLKSPRQGNPSSRKLTPPLCHTKSPLRLSNTSRQHVKTLPSKAKMCHTLSPLTQIKHIKVTPSQIKPNSSQAKSPVEARSPLSLIKSPINKSKTFVTPSTRSLERKICDRKRNLKTPVIPTVDVTPLKMSRLRDDQKKPIKKDSTLCSHTKCPTPLRLSVTKKRPSKCGDHEVDPTPTHKVVTPVSPQSSPIFHTLSPTNSSSVTPPMSLGQEWRKKTLTPLGSILSLTSSTSVSPSVSPSLTSGQRGGEMVSTRSLTQSDSVTPTMISESRTPLRLSPTSATANIAPGLTPLLPEQTGSVYKRHVLTESRPHYSVETHGLRLEVDTGSTDEPGKASLSPDTKTAAQRSGKEERSLCTNDEDMTGNSSNIEDRSRDNSENDLELALSVSSILSEMHTDSGNKLKCTSIKKHSFQKPCCSSSHGDNNNGTVILCLEDMNSTAAKKCVQKGNNGDCQKGHEKPSEEQLRAGGALEVSHNVMLRKRLSVDIPSSDVDAHCSLKKAKLSDSDSVAVDCLTGSEDPLTQDEKISSQDVNLDVDVHSSCDRMLRGDREHLGQVVEVGNLDSSDLNITEVSTVSSDTVIDKGSCSVRKASEGSSETNHRSYKKRYIDSKKDYDLRNKKKLNENKRCSVGVCNATVNHRHSRKTISSSKSENVISKHKCSCKVGRRNCRGRHSNKCEVSKRKEHSSEDTDSKHQRGYPARKSKDFVDRQKRKYENRTSKSSSNRNALKPRSQVIKSHGKMKSRRDSRVAAEKENIHRITFNIIQGDQLTQPRLRLRKCVYCGTFCTRLAHIMREHVTIVHPHKCLTCHVAFKNKLEARAHKLTRHLKEVHHCMLCHKVLMSRVRYERHIRCKSHMRLMEAQREALGAICRAFFQGGQEDFSETLRKVQSQETGLWNPEKGGGKKALLAPGNEPAPPPQPAPNLSHLRHFYYDNPELGQMVKKFEEFSPAQNLVLGSMDPSATVSYTDPQSDVFFFPLPPVQDSESWTLTTETESETEISTHITVQDRDLLDLSLSEALGTAISEWQDPLPSGRVSENPNISNVYTNEEQLMSDNRANIELMSIDSNDQPSSCVRYGNGNPQHSDSYLCQTDTELVTDSATESSVFSDMDDAHRMFQLMSLPNRSQGSVQPAGSVTLTSTSTKMPSSADVNTRLSSSQNNCPVLLPQETETALTTDNKVVTGQFGETALTTYNKVVTGQFRETALTTDNKVVTGQFGETALTTDNKVVTGQFGETALTTDNKVVTGQFGETALTTENKVVTCQFGETALTTNNKVVTCQFGETTLTTDNKVVTGQFGETALTTDNKVVTGQFGETALTTDNKVVTGQFGETTLTTDNKVVTGQFGETALTTDNKVVTCQFEESTICPIDKSLSVATHPVQRSADVDNCQAYANSIAIVDQQLGNTDMNSYANTESNDKEVSRLENRDDPLCLSLTNMVDVDTGPPAPLMLPASTSTSDRSNTCFNECQDSLTCDDPLQARTSSALDTDHPCALISHRTNCPPVECQVTELSSPSCTSNISQTLPLKLPAIPSNILQSHQCNVRLLCNYTDSSEDESSAGDDSSLSQVRTGQDTKITDYSSKSQNSVDAEVTENQVRLDQDGKPTSPVPGTIVDGSGNLGWSKQRTHLSPLHNSADVEETKDLVQSRQDSKTNCSGESSDVKEVDDSEECRLKAEFCLLLKEIAEDEKFLGTV